MHKYIDRESAVKELNRLYDLLSVFSPQFYNGFLFAKKQLEQFPAVDVAPVVHGRWDSSGKYMFADGSVAVRCDQCGAALDEEEYKKCNWNYCPSCGARMDGGKDNARR